MATIFDQVLELQATITTLTQKVKEAETQVRRGQNAIIARKAELEQAVSAFQSLKAKLPK